VVVLISLFSAGVKMPVPVSFARWRADSAGGLHAAPLPISLMRGDEQKPSVPDWHPVPN
jgi:hypothetical protein